MRKINEISEIEFIKENKAQGIYYKKTSKELYSLKQNMVVVNDIFDFQFIKDGIVFTQSEIGELFIKRNETEILSGFFYLSFFHQVSGHYALVRNDSIDDLTNKVVLADETFKNLKPFKPFRAYLNGHFATSFKNEIVVFDNELTEKWRKPLNKIDSSLAKNDKLKRKFYEVGKNIIVLPFNSGRFLAVDVVSGNMIWKQDELGRLSVFKNKIYCIANYSLRELDANTGKVLQEENIEPLINTFNFRPTGEHKIYEDYIFSMSTGKPGMIAIFERDSLKFKDLIKLEEMIPIGQDNLIWHNNKLFVLDSAKILHVFENN